jgi:hypothetical protein
MKYTVLFLLFTCVLCAQNDTIYFKRETQKLDTTVGASFDNYYAPWHPTIKDTLRKSVVSKVGVYASVAIGYGNVATYENLSALLSCSIAYKSHLFTFTRAGYGQLVYGGSQGETTYNGSYMGLLYGQSIRFKYAMVSLSAGVAYANIIITDNIPQKPPIVNYQGVSVPIELKVLFYARNGIGLGVHVAKNIVAPYTNSPFYLGFALVFGKWNTVKRNYNRNFGG